MEKNNIFDTLKKLNFLNVFILLISIFVFYNLSEFIGTFLFAVIFYITGIPVVNFLHLRLKINKTVAIFLFFILIGVLVFIPSYILVKNLTQKITFYLQENNFNYTFKDIEVHLNSLVGFDIINDDNLLTAQKALVDYFSSAFNESVTILTNIFLMFFGLYFMLMEDHKFEKAISSIIPLKEETKSRLYKELNSQVYSNVLITPLLAAIQGLLAYGIYLYFGVKDPFFWGIITAVFSFIPFVGSAIIWFPISMYFLFLKDYFSFIGIILSGGIFISSADNVIRFFLQKKFADIHPLITVLGLLSGIKIFGIAGIIFGPLLLSYLFILIKYSKE